MNRPPSHTLASPTLSDEDSLSIVLHNSLSITSSRSSLTSDELLREADFCARDAALRSREAEVLLQEANQLRRAANLTRREERQDLAEELVNMHSDTSAFWDSLQDAPSEDESDLTASVDESDLTTSVSSNYTGSTVSAPPRNQPGAPTHCDPPATPEPAKLGDTRLYAVSSPGRQDIIATWATAGHHTLPHPHTQARLVSTPPRTRHAPYKYFSIVKGTHPGVYEGHWHHYIHLVNYVPNTNYKGFQKLDEANMAYIIAYALGFVKAIPARNCNDLGPPAPTPSLITTTPSQNEILAALSSASPNFLGQTWYAVFKGIRPGVYPSWNFVSDLVRGVSTATYRGFESCEAAETAFRRARRNGEVAELRGGRSYVMPAP